MKIVADSLFAHFQFRNFDSNVSLMTILDLFWSVLINIFSAKITKWLICPSIFFFLNLIKNPLQSQNTPKMLYLYFLLRYFKIYKFTWIFSPCSPSKIPSLHKISQKHPCSRNNKICDPWNVVWQLPCFLENIPFHIKSMFWLVCPMEDAIMKKYTMNIFYKK